MTDASGRALPDLEVVLEATHRSFDIRRLQRAHRDLTRRTTTTNSDGRFQITWHPNEHFNHFELAVGLPVRIPDGERFFTLERMQLGKRMEGGDLPAIDVVVADTSFLERYRAFVAALDSADERAVYEQMGIPAKIDRMKLATHEEITWWYFEAGKAFRFHDGALSEVSEFEPVLPFEGDGGGPA